jgi:adenylate cyclase
MKKTWKRALICAAIALGSVLLTLLMEKLEFFKGLDLKAQDAHFVIRGTRPTKNITLIEIDDKTRSQYTEPLFFWQPHYAEAMRAVLAGGGKVMLIDNAFLINVKKYAPDNDALLGAAYGEVAPQMPVVCAFVPVSAEDQQKEDVVVPINILASVFGLTAFPNVTADNDDFIRRQELIELPKAGQPVESLTRGLALRAAEKFVGKDVEMRDGKMFLAGREIAVDSDGWMTINYAGPADTFPRASLYDVIEAYHAGNTAQLEKWFKGKAALLGTDDRGDRRATPFYTAFGKNTKWTTPGVEVHANVLNTLLTGEFLKPVPEWVRLAALLLTAILCLIAVISFTAVYRTALASTLVFATVLIATHISFRAGWLLSSSQMMYSFAWALLSGVIYRFATAEKKSSFFKTAVALFVGRQVASSLDEKQEFEMTGKRQKVTILFTDIRGFTAFCESKDPAIVVDLLNTYMSTMVSIIVKNGGHVNKFIGDGILAVFSDDDPGAKPGDHALRTTICATEMVEQVIGEFKTGAGYHSGEVVIGNVGSSDKLEFTVLGNTVNLASRLESLNKEARTRLLMSEESLEMLGGAIDTVYLGAVPVKGKTEKMKLFSVTSLFDEARLGEIRAEHPQPANMPGARSRQQMEPQPEAQVQV